MEEALHEMEAGLRALGDRVEAIATELSGDIECLDARAGQSTHRLAREVADLGSALAQRIRSVERLAVAVPAAAPTAAPAPAPRPPRAARAVTIIAALALVAAVALAGFWMADRLQQKAPPRAEGLAAQTAGPTAAAPSPATTSPEADTAGTVQAPASRAVKTFPHPLHHRPPHLTNRPLDRAQADHGTSGYGAYHGPSNGPPS
jgi:hypothetical protein